MEYFRIPLAEWTDRFIDWLLVHFVSFFDAIGDTVQTVLLLLLDGLRWLPPELVVITVVAIAWRYGGRNLALFALIGFIIIGSLSLWDEMLITLVVVLVSTVLSVAIGVPLGILASQSDTAERIVRPVLDIMQTMPSFVYLIPVLLFFGMGLPAAVTATIIFAMPPAVRLTNLGIRNVDAEVVEAARSFGATRSQMLLKVLLPQARPTIMAGINQTIMLALSMAVITAMIGGEGLGKTVLYGISRVAPGIGLEGGIGIVILAILLDRISSAAGSLNKRQELG